VRRPLALALLLAAPAFAQSDAARPVLLERVDDVAIAQLYADGFENLSASDQALCWQLTRAAIAGRDIFLQQKCAVGLEVRDVLEELLTHEQGIDAATLAELRRYADLFWVNNGIYNAITARKNLLHCTPEQLLSACKQAVPAGAELPAKPEALVEALKPWLFDPAFEPMCTAKNPEGGLDIVQASACTFYERGVTLEELEGFKEEHELNSNIVKGADGQLVEQVWRAGSAADGIPPGLYAPELNRVIDCLQDALPFAPAPTRTALEKLMHFYRTGAVADREAYDIAWVADNASPVDTLNGFVEVYVDPRGKKGSWEGLVSYEDPKKAALIKGLADSAQWFEDHMPYDAAFRKPKVKGISARSIDVVCESGDSGPVTPVGINLPNDQRIREEYGSKSVSLGNVVTASDALSGSGVREEFCWDEEEMARNQKWSSITGEMLTNMHEVIGHASGQQDAAHQGDPATWIKENFSALEEARADLVGLYFMADPKLKEMGLLDDPAEAARAYYESYTRNALLLQLRRVRVGDQLEEDHMRNRQMIAHWILTNSSAIEEHEREGKHFYVVTDAAAWREAAGRLLALVQQIKSTGDYEGAKQLFDDNGVHFDTALRDEVVARYDKLGVPSYTGFVQPRLSPVWGVDGALSDVTISYPQSLRAQMLEWSGRRLPPVTLPADPSAVWQTALHRLLEAPDLELQVHCLAQGTHTADMNATLRLREGNRLELSASGALDGVDMPRSVHADGQTVTVHAGGKPETQPVSERLNEAVVQGLMARGLLHNLAFLASGSPPDLVDGTTSGGHLKDVKALGDGTVNGHRTRRIGYSLAVGDQVVAQGTLDIDRERGVPLAREVTVHFPQGDMHATETYVFKRPVE
jgi:dipeptidyl-peptidase-3